MRRKNISPTAFRDLLASLDLSSEDGPFPSPCVGICHVHEKTGFCEGCFRTIEEITSWGGAIERDKHVIWQIVKKRHDASLPRLQEQVGKQKIRAIIR